MLKDYEKPSLIDNLSKLSLVSIGPFTSEELKKFDVSFTMAKIHTVAGAFAIQNIF